SRSTPHRTARPQCRRTARHYAAPLTSLGTDPSDRGKHELREKHELTLRIAQKRSHRIVVGNLREHAPRPLIPVRPYPVDAERGFRVSAAMNTSVHAEIIHHSMGVM